MEGLQSKGSIYPCYRTGECCEFHSSFESDELCHHTATQRQLGRQGVNNNAVVQFMLHVLHVCEAGRLISPSMLANHITAPESSMLVFRAVGTSARRNRHCLTYSHTVGGNVPASMWMIHHSRSRASITSSLRALVMVSGDGYGDVCTDPSQGGSDASRQGALDDAQRHDDGIRSRPCGSPAGCSRSRAGPWRPQQRPAWSPEPSRFRRATPRAGRGRGSCCRCSSPGPQRAS